MYASEQTHTSKEQCENDEQTNQGSSSMVQQNVHTGTGTAKRTKIVCFFAK